MPPADLPTLPRRRRDTSKRDYGRVVVVGGAAGMAGAPALAASAALRSGAGLVEALVPEQIVAIAASFDPCVMTRGLPGRNDGTFATASAVSGGQGANVLVPTNATNAVLRLKGVLTGRPDYDHPPVV
ncbi:MAG: NAD(P)H-hydrate dehydratase, partial [Planctomycetia bacterium]